MTTGPEIYDALARARMEAARQLETKIQSRLQQALQVNADYRVLDPPTNEQIRAQVLALTLEISGLIRLVLHRLDTDD